MYGNTTNWNQKMHKQEPNYPKIEVLKQTEGTFTLKENGREDAYITSDLVVNESDWQ
jgi:hypothetical protein